MSSSSFQSYHFEGEIAVPEDQVFTNGYVQCPFEVPAGVEMLRCRLHYAPQKAANLNNLITLALFDPSGFRGNAHRHSPNEEVTISPGYATPGFVPGPVSPGAWLAQLAVHTVMREDGPCRYTVDIDLLPQAGEEAPSKIHPELSLDTVVPGPAGWLRGELHSHTHHSDGRFTVEELLLRARQRPLDFLAVTDHNTVTALNQIDPSQLGGLVVIPGLELTTFHGHALALGIDQWVDWRTGYNGWTMEDAARRVRALGGLFVLAHPNDLGSPVCTGCRWEYEDFDLNLADALEIWNGWWPGWEQSNAKTLALWQSLQAERPLPATCGSDYHNEPDWGAGRPSTYVWVEERSAAGVLEGIRKGRMVLSNGPWVELCLSADEHSQPVGIGGTLHAAGAPVWLSARWSGAPEGACLTVQSSQGPAREHLTGSGTGSLTEWVSGSPQGCWWAVLTAQDGELLAVTNPVFLNNAS